MANKEIWLKYLSLRKRYKELSFQEKGELYCYFNIINSTYGAFGVSPKPSLV